jgi:hypothetical protein
VLTVLPPLERRRRWPLALASAALHLSLVLLMVWLTMQAEPERKHEQAPADQHRQVNMVYLPPVRPRAPAPKPAPAPTPAPTQTQPPKPIDRERDTRPPSTKPAVPDPNPGQSALATRATTDQPKPGANAPENKEEKSAGETPAEAPTMESEAQRLFGRHDSGNEGAGPRDQFGTLAALGLSGGSAGESDCRPVPHPPLRPGEPPRMATVSGRIYRRDNGRPLAYANLQMIGTPYTAYSDAEGRYTFSFDQSLVEDCRTQLVRISAPGYKTELVSVLVAPYTRESDVGLAPGR